VPEGRLSNAPLIAIIEDDQFFRGSMRRLMRSLGYPVEAFPSAADFLASRRLDETACLIADIHMPGMTGVELYACLIEAGHKADREAQPHSVRLGGIEGVENAFEMFRINSRPRITHRDQDLIRFPSSSAD